MFHRITLLPFVRVDKDVPDSTSTPLNLEEVPEYLRKNIDSVLETYTATGSDTFYTKLDAYTLVPYVNGTIVPRANVQYYDDRVVISPAPYPGTTVTLYQTSLNYRSPTDLESQRAWDDLPDYMLAAYNQEKLSIHKYCTKYTYISVNVRHEEAPELVALDYLKDMGLWFVIMEVNKIIFPQELYVGRIIRIPQLSDVNAWLAACKSKTAYSDNTNSLYSYKGTNVKI